VLSKLPARERVFLRLVFESGFTVAEATRSLGLDGKKYYRKREAVLELLRTELERQGIGKKEAFELVETLDWDAALDLQGAESVQELEQCGPGPSLGRDDTGRPDGGR
jgi:hypothetical protein